MRFSKLSNGYASKQRQRWLVVAGSTIAVVATCLLVRHWWLPREVGAQAPAPQQPAAPAASSTAPKVSAKKPIPAVVAVINGERITRAQLGAACVKQYGSEVLESLINKRLIEQACAQRNITVSQEEVKREIERLAQRFGLPVDQWLKMLQEERDITPEQYAYEIIWPTLALEKLAADRLQVDEIEIQRAYETLYGPARQVRLIACETPEAAQEVRQAALANPDDFPKLAIKHSKDYGSASLGGLIQPIRKHVGDSNIEQAAFSLAVGQISHVIPVHKQFVIIKCEKHLPPRPVDVKSIRKELVKSIKEKKLRTAGHDVFRELQNLSNVENVLNDRSLRGKYPGVAAIINDERISIDEITEECMLRHGKKVVEAMIGHKLLEQACKSANKEPTDAEVQLELADTAASYGVFHEDGRPDVQAFLDKMSEQSELPAEVYTQEMIWPAVALRKLVKEEVQVTNEDLQRGYEANYGERVRCRAIVFKNQRHAREVWEMARRELTKENFARLAEQYSVDPASRALGGEIPPIARNSGRPVLEEEAFRLKQGELSSIIQYGEHWVILLCEGRTEPIGVTFEEVKSKIHEDVLQKKLQRAMAGKFAHIREHAQIDNILAGTSQSGAGGKSIGHADTREPRTARPGTPVPRTKSLLR